MRYKHTMCINAPKKLRALTLSSETFFFLSSFLLCSFSYLFPLPLSCPRFLSLSLAHTLSCSLALFRAHTYYGVASMSRLLKSTGLFCKRAL